MAALTKEYSKSGAGSLWQLSLKGHAASSLFFGTCTLEALSCYVVSPTTLKLPCYEEAKPQGEAMWKHSGQQSLSLSHQVLSHSSSLQPLSLPSRGLRPQRTETSHPHGTHYKFPIPRTRAPNEMVVVLIC